ncbi:glutaminase [Microbacterium sp. X-17]|uniref:glutaminase n=1 Tax=Microbacterium sp. X-17 TaxID=3144404 RepID=UPI0031F56437
MEEVEDLLHHARARLARVPREALGTWRDSRRVLGFGRGARIVPAGDAWHLGVLLLTDDAALATGEILRAREPVPRGYAAQSQRERAERAEAAFRGGFPAGALVHVGWTPLDLIALDRAGDAGPLTLLGGRPAVRWSRAAGAMPLADYLDERISLAGSPSPGA